jgi:predicted transcriptional regulator
VVALSRRERQILDTLYKLGKGSAAEIRDAMSDPPGYSAMRALLRILEEKGHVRHEVDGPRYVYLPAVSRRRARTDALKHLIETFFEGSALDAAVALMDGSAGRMKPEELERLQQMIEQARKEKES